MEQRIGSSSQPLDGAGIDPAFIPGLTSPMSTEKEDMKAETAKAEEPEATDEAEQPVEPEAASVEDGDGDSEEASAESESEDEPDADEEGDSEETPEGPVFEASDRRARIIADHRGVRLFLDDQECEFRWDEIGAVETESPRFGKRFTITVYTPEKRWYPIEIEAKSRSRFQEWDAELDKVLDAYFDDGDAEDAEPEAEPEAKAEVETKAADDEA